MQLRPLLGQLAVHRLMAILGIGQICAWGTLYYSFPQIAEAMIVDLGWSKSEVYFGLTLALLSSAFSAWPIGRLFDRGQGRSVMIIGSMLSGVLLLLAAKVESLWAFYLVFSGIGFLHGATLYDAAFAYIANSFDAAKTRKLITQLSLWGGFASTVFIPLVELLLQNLSWRDTLSVLAMFNLLLCPLLYAALPSGHGDAGVGQASLSKTSEANSAGGLNHVIRQPLFWALTICFTCVAAAATSFRFHLYPLLAETDLALADIMLLMMIIGPSQVLGRFVLGQFAEGISISTLGLLTCSLLPLVFLAFYFEPQHFGYFVLALVVFGSASGIMTIIKGVAVPELLSDHSYGVINSMMKLPVKIVAAFAPVMAAALWQVSHGYTTVMFILFLVSLVPAFSFLFIWVLGRQRQNKLANET